METYFFNAHCTYVVDGDTADLTIDVGFHLTTVQRMRFLDINTPERGKPGYQEAKDYTKNAILGKDVIVQTYKDDAFGRYLAHIYYIGEDGAIHNLNQELLDLGLAVPFVK
jgi:micrococcal nuclease